MYGYNWGNFDYYMHFKIYSCTISTPLTWDVVEPDTVIVRDIHLLDSLYVGILETYEISNSFFELFPNPINSSLEINYKISLPVKSSTCFIDIYMLNGKKIKRYAVLKDTGLLKFPSFIKKYIC